MPLGGTSLLVRIAIILLAIAIAGCRPRDILPPQADAIGNGAVGRAAKPPDCNMPVLRMSRCEIFRKVGDRRALGNRFASESEVLRQWQRKACEHRGRTRSWC